MDLKIKMRITFPMFGLGGAGGEKWIAKLSNGLVERNHEVFWVLPKSSYKKVYTTRAKLIEVPRCPNFLKTFLLAANIPPSDIICAAAGLSTLSVLLAAKLLKKGTALYCPHNYDALFYPKTSQFLQRKIIDCSFSYFDHIITISQWMKDMIYLKTGRNPLIIHPAVDLEVFWPRNTKKNSKIKTVLCLGREAPIKGLTDLVKAMEIVCQRYCDVKLVIVSRSDIKINTTIPYEQVRATDDELAQYYSSCDVFVTPSWYEGFPAPPLEAMACGAAVVSTDCLGIREYGKNDVNCLIVPPRTPALLAESILKIIENPSLAKRLGENGVKTAQGFSYDKMIHSFEKACFKVLMNT